nr:JmjC domain-containing protein [Tanacetum cinerariifolium]
MRPSMNCVRPNRSFINIHAHSYETRPVHRKSAVRSPYRAPWVPTVNRNYPPVNRKLPTALHDPIASTTPSKPDNQERSLEQEISPTTLDAVLTLSHSKTRARAAKIIYKRLKKLQSSSGPDFTDTSIPAVGGVSTGGVNPAVVVSAGSADPVVVVSAGSVDPVVVLLVTLIFAGVSVVTGPSVASAPSAFAAQSTPRQAELDRIALNIKNEEWIGLVDQVWANPTLSAELLGADVSEDTFSVCMVELMNQRRKAIAEMKAKAKRDKPLTPAQQKDTEQSAELPETTSVSTGATLAAGDPISTVPFVFAVPSISAAYSIPAKTPIAAGVSTTAGISKSASVPIIDLLDSPPKATSLPLDPETTEQAVPLRKSSKKKSMARRRTLSRSSQSESATLPFDEDGPEAEFKKYLRPVSDDDEPAEPDSLSLVSDIRTWEVIPTEFGLVEIHVITRANGSVKRFSTLRELMHWAGRADLMVLYGMVLDKISKRSKSGDSMLFLLFMILNHGLEIDRDLSGNDLTTAIQLIQSLLNQLHPAT